MGLGAVKVDYLLHSRHPNLPPSVVNDCPMVGRAQIQTEVREPAVLQD